VWIWIKTRLFGRTPRDIREWTQPPDFEYAIYYSNILFMVAVGLVFAPLAPLVAAAAAVVFFISSFVYKYQLMFVYVSKVESGGRLWNVVVNRLLWTVVYMQALMVLTVGLQEGWKSFQWVSTLPPILFIFIFKVYINRTFVAKFNWYIPTDEELRMAKVHSERSDNRGGKLEKRFGHPALHAELFTPMLHAKMMHLLPEVYHGRIKNESATMEEYGGQKMEASVLPGGIKIAAVHQSELEYDPALYQRDRGELDWDQRSIGSTAVLTMNDGASLQHAKSQFYANATPARPAGYDKYISQGPTHEIEMSRMGRSGDQLPLLADPGATSIYDQYSNPATMSQTTLVPPYNQHNGYNGGGYDMNLTQTRTPSPGGGYAGQPLYPPGVPRPQYPQQVQQGLYGEREATLHRPSPPSRSPSSFGENGSMNGSSTNLAGRGAHQRPY